MKKIVFIVGMCFAALSAQDKSDKVFNHEIGVETFLRAEGSAFFDMPLPNFGTYYRYYFPTESRAQSFVSGGAHLIVESTNGFVVTMYAEYGVRIIKEGKRWNPILAVQNAYAFQMYTSYSPFVGVQLNFRANLLSFKTKRGNNISFCNPRIDINFENLLVGEALLGVSLFDYAVRF